MRTTVKPLLVLAVVVFASSLRADDSKAPEGDLAKLQGTWKAMLGQNKEIPAMMRIKGNELILDYKTPQGVQIALIGQIKLDEQAKPKTMDWFKMTLREQSVPDNLAIYELDGDTLKIRGGGVSKQRPREFAKDDDPDPRVRSLVFTREKAESTDAARSDDDKPKDEKADDLSKLQGTWKGMVGENKEVPITVVIKDKTVTAKFVNGVGQEIEIKGELKLDDKAKPKTVDWVKFKRENGDDMPDNLGIYELKGDEWKVCNGGPGNPRPTEFKEAEGGDPHGLIVLTRVKDAK